MKLYGYYRSSASYRVRIALNFKKLSYAQEPIHLTREGGQQFSEQYQKVNPQSLVPALEDKGAIINQSIAIMEYLEDAYPEHPILPKDIIVKAKVRAFSQMIACDIHPLNNLRVLKYLTEILKVEEGEKQTWYAHWLHKGFTALEDILQNAEKQYDFCFGTTPTMADMCLVPQVYNAERFKCPLDAFPNIRRVNENCLKLSSFIEAHPNQQPDAEL